MASEQQERYTLGYGAAIMQSLTSRTAAGEARFFLPYLRPGMSLLDCGYGPGGMTTTPFSEQVIELGWASRAELEEIGAFWRAWSERTDAFYAKPNGEAVGWKE